MMRRKDKGDLYVHQDANWNVIGTTDLGRHVVEHNFLSPYGELTVNQETGFGDRDGDGDVDSTDKGTVGTTCTGTVSGSCRILDLDFDGDYDSTDATNFDALPQGYIVRPGLAATATSQPFAHQGLLFEPEIASYQNRARQYTSLIRRFLQRDSLGLSGEVDLQVLVGLITREFSMLTRADQLAARHQGHLFPSAGEICPICYKYRSSLQYLDGLSLQSYQRSNPVRHTDAYGFGSCGSSRPPNCNGTCADRMSCGPSNANPGTCACSFTSERDVICGSCGGGTALMLPPMVVSLRFFRRRKRRSIRRAAFRFIRSSLWQ